ncbi:MAG: peptide chain release factor N(5)-glutamine methyltransferase [bacterium]|nr:peptide chain release factor N(5)-glutamine methyltransferase [bacterium]
MTIQEILRQAEQRLKSAGIDSARLDSEVLLAYVLGYSRSELLVHSAQQLNSDQMVEFLKLVQARKEHQPVAYLTGIKEFMGLDFLVTPEVLIPRPETEILVETTLQIISNLAKQKLRILDIGTGSGNIAISLAKQLELAEVVALDISEQAIAVAKQNAILHQVNDRIRFIKSALFDNISETENRFEIIVSNPPYIPEPEFEQLSLDIREYEPHQALTGGNDGLNIIRKIIQESADYLTQQGYLIMELGDGQAKKVRNLIEQSSQFDIQSTRFIFDLAGKERVVVTKRK